MSKTGEISKAGKDGNVSKSVISESNIMLVRLLGLVSLVRMVISSGMVILVNKVPGSKVLSVRSISVRLVFRQVNW